MEATGSPPAEATTIVCAIEYGRIEAQTLLMLESLRQRGGAFGQSRVLAVIPRPGLPLKPTTRARLDELGVELHDASKDNRITWFPYFCKNVAVLVAERVATTPLITWFDGDVLVMDPPVDVVDLTDADLRARREFLYPSVQRGDDQHVSYWRRVSELVGVDWESMPWLPADGPYGEQRLYLNSGIYTFRRGLGVGQAYADLMEQLIRSRLALRNGDFWINDQIILSMCILKLGLRFRELSRDDHHMVFQGLIDGPGATPMRPDAHLLHYSGSMYPEHWGRFMERLRVERPEFCAWLEPKGPILPQKFPRSPIGLARKAYRNLRYRYFGRTVVRS